MGIKGLWNVLSPYCENKPLCELRGEKVAIDLSGWVCDAQNITEHYVQPKIYLRNLFFRTSYLLLNDITPFFVLDGDAPQDKLSVMQERNKRQFRGVHRYDNTNGEASSKSKPKTDRKRFKSVLKECCDLLTSLGVQYIAAEGEAEQLCALLNADGIVTGVVSSDSDCFAYGATRVIRNLSPESVDVYDINNFQRDIGWGRYKCICMAFLCGCDYFSGLTSSNATAAAFLHSIPDDEAIDRIKSWRTDDGVYLKLMKDSKQRIACKPCEKCTDVRSSVAKAKAELKFVEKARAMVEDFPPPLILDEFIKSTSYIETVITTWNKPDLIKFSRIMMVKLSWNERYCVEKLVPLITGWQLRQTGTHAHTLKPSRINKLRKVQGVPSVEVVWNDSGNLYTEFVPDDQFEVEEPHEKIWTTVEPVELFTNHYSRIYEEFMESKRKPKKKGPKLKEAKSPKKRGGRKKKDVSNQEMESKITEYLVPALDDISKPNDTENISIKKLKGAGRKRKTPQTTTMKTVKLSKKTTLQITLRTFVNNKRNMSHSRTMGDSLVSNNDSVCNLSDIVDNIIKRKRGNMKYGDMELVFDRECEVPLNAKTRLSNFHSSVHCSTPKKSEGRRLSLFFEPFQVDEPDDFELSLSKMVNPIEPSPERTLEYEIAKLSLLDEGDTSKAERQQDANSEALYNDISSSDEVYESLSVRVAKLKAGLL